MTIRNGTNLHRLIKRNLGAARTEALFATLSLDAYFAEVRPAVTAAEISMAMNCLLFADLLQRVPTGDAYVQATVAGGGRITFDHGALRTICFAQGRTGELPGGVEAFRRILEPLGYRMANKYPLPSLRMTGYAWCHEALPETIPQFFVSELHVDRFSANFQEAAARVFGTTRDPLTAPALELLHCLAKKSEVSFAMASAGLTELAAAFARQHEPPSITDYEALLSESAEAAWIATEGNAFNHATDRVDDVVAVSERLRAARYPIKPGVEHSSSGRVRQTAFRADSVEREFHCGQTKVTRTVPGSFYEFISRDIDPISGRLDLAFDSSNAQGIFAMTKAA
jgi:hypothetical protein